MKIVKLAVLTALINFGVARASADQTNVVQNLSVQLRGVQPGDPVTNRFTVTTGLGSVRIDTRDVIKALGLATSNLFSRSARLVIVTPVGGGDSAIQIRDGSGPVDVTRFFLHEQVSGLVSGSVSNTATHRTLGLDYSIQRFALRDAEGGPALGLHFDVRGFAVERSPDNGRGGVGQLQLDAAGAGDAGGNLLILRGDIDVQGGRLEVVPSVSGPTT